MVIYINILNENQFIKLENSDENSIIYSIKQEIQKIEYIPIKEQILYYQDSILEDNKLLNYYTSEKSITINLLIMEIPFEIKLKMMTGKEIIIKNITSHILIEEIFLLLFYYNDLHPDDINLVFQGKVLDRSKKLCYYKIIDQSTLNIIIKLKTGF